MIQHLPPVIHHSQVEPVNYTGHCCHHRAGRSLTESLSHFWGRETRCQMDRWEFQCPSQHLRSQPSWTASSAESPGLRTLQTWGCSPNRTKCPLTKWAPVSRHTLRDKKIIKLSTYNIFVIVFHSIWLLIVNHCRSLSEDNQISCHKLTVTLLWKAFVHFPIS